MADFSNISSQNLVCLNQNKYPGRGIIIGITPSEKYFVQIYWTMGRSQNSRNRIFEEENGWVKTKIFNENIEGDRSLIIYYPIKVIKDFHIVTNGDHTETIYEYKKNGKTFMDALDTREFEPDPPNYTPRISGFVDLCTKKVNYGLSILKTINNDNNICQRNYFYYQKFIKGYGHCIHTYCNDGNPIPSFDKEPYLIKLYEKIEDNLNNIWEKINIDNKVSILVKYIAKEGKQTMIQILNKNK